MMTKTIEKKDYLGNKICKGQKQENCLKCTTWECEEVIETETVSVMSGGEG